MSSIPVLVWHRQEDLYEFKGSLVYKVSYSEKPCLEVNKAKQNKEKLLIVNTILIVKM